MNTFWLASGLSLLLLSGVGIAEARSKKKQPTTSPPLIPSLNDLVNPSLLPGFPNLDPSAGFTPNTSASCDRLSSSIDRITCLQRFQDKSLAPEALDNRTPVLPIPPNGTSPPLSNPTAFTPPPPPTAPVPGSVVQPNCPRGTSLLLLPGGYACLNQ
uniref:Uncharacterized protein n=1 Tax=Cyanothece sp. (strain PCC 7425 / ATCC 29141) TaxID=395961 RepID=B8HXT0_CYAP4